MPEDKDVYSIEDVIRELKVGEEELKRMVSEGELRAFRSGDKMRFRKEDIESLKKARLTEPTVVMPPPKVEKPKLDLEIDKEVLSLSETTFKEKEAPPPVKEETTPISIDTTPIAFEETDLKIAGEEPVVIPTEPAPPEEDTLQLVEAETTEETQTTTAMPAEEAGEETVSTPTGVEEAPPEVIRKPRRRIAAPVAKVAAVEAPPVSPFWTVVTFASLALALLCFILIYDTFMSERTGRPAGISSGLYKWVLEQMWSGHRWTQDHPDPADCSDPPPKSPTFTETEYQPQIPDINTLISKYAQELPTEEKPPVEKAPPPEKAPPEEEAPAPEPETPEPLGE